MKNRNQKNIEQFIFMLFVHKNIKNKIEQYFFFDNKNKCDVNGNEKKLFTKLPMQSFQKKKNPHSPRNEIKL